MIKVGSEWRTSNGKVFVVTEVADGYVHYRHGKQEYSCYTEAFQYRFFPICTKRYRL